METAKLLGEKFLMDLRNPKASFALGGTNETNRLTKKRNKEEEEEEEEEDLKYCEQQAIHNNCTEGKACCEKNRCC